MLLALTVPRRQVGQLAATYSSSLTNQIQHRSGVTFVCGIQNLIVLKAKSAVYGISVAGELQAYTTNLICVT